MSGHLPGSLHILITLFLVFRRFCLVIFFTLNFPFACLALLSKKVNKLLCNILVTSLPKKSKTKLPKWDENLKKHNQTFRHFWRHPPQTKLLFVFVQYPSNLDIWWKGEEITTRYYPPWEGQPIRQDKVSKHWQYLCCCERCKDPTEFGTYFSAIR